MNLCLLIILIGLQTLFSARRTTLSYTSSSFRVIRELIININNKSLSFLVSQPLIQNDEQYELSLSQAKRLEEVKVMFPSSAILGLDLTCFGECIIEVTNEDIPIKQ